jgi:MFS family permease
MSESSHVLASPAETLAGEPSKQLSLTHKLVLLLMFCFAQFLEAFNNAALVPAIPTLMRSMGITGSQSAWILSAFQLTFASFLLIVRLVTFLLAT